MITQGVSTILAIAGLMLMTRYLGTEGYGTIVWTLAFLAIFNSIADLGFGSAHTKRVSEGQDLNLCVSTFAYLKGVLTLAMAVFVICVIGGWSLFSENPLSSYSIRIMLVLLVYQILGNLTMIVTITFDARMQTAKSQLIQICDPLTRLPLLIFVLTNGMGVDIVTLAYLAGGIVAICAAIFQIRRQHIAWQKPKLIHSYTKWAIPMIVVVVAGAILTQLPTTMIGFFWSKTDVAYFSSALALLAYLGILGSSAMVLLFPTFSKLASEGNFDAIRSASRQGERYLSLISLPILTTIIVFPHQIAGIFFGDAYTSAGEVLPYVAVATYIGLLNLTVSAQVLGMNRADLYMKWTCLNLVLTVVLLIVLVPSNLFGIQAIGLSYRGAAYASAISAFASFGVARWLTYSLTKTKPNQKILKHIAAATVIGIAMYYAGTFYPVTHWFEAAIYLLISLGGFLGILYCLREFTAQDLHFFLDTLNLRKMEHYVTTELSHKKKE